MKKYYLYIILFCSLSATAQLTYDLKKENTDIKFAGAKLDIWDVLVSTSRMTFSGGAGGKLYLNGLYVNVNYDFHYLDGLAEASSAGGVDGSSIYKPTNSRNADATVGYFFQKASEGKTKISLGTHVYTKVNAHYNKFFGLQLGYKKGFSNLYIPAGVNVHDYYLPESGTITTAGAMSTYMQYGWISFGPSYGKTIDIEGDFKEYGIRKKQSFLRFYANVVLAGKSKLDDVYFTTGSGTGPTGTTNDVMVHRYVLDGVVDMSKIGFHIGFEEYKFNGFGVSYGLEAGIMPGVKGPGNGYLAIKWGFVFGKAFGG